MNWIEKLNGKVIITGLGIILGALGGYLYYQFYGCEGSCAITSSPFNSSLYGSIMGGILFSGYSKDRKSG